MGNITFALGLILIDGPVTYGIRPYGGHPTGWGSPKVLACWPAASSFWRHSSPSSGGPPNPMFRLPLFRIRAFTFGTLSTFLAAVARGGLMFILIIWLQGIWLPEHGYDFAETPLWAGIYMLPLSLGCWSPGPSPAILSDHFGARLFATGGMLGAAASFGLLMLLPVDFPYPAVRPVLLLNGISMGLFVSPNRAAVMNSLPAQDRGAGGGMNQTFQNSAQVLSIGIFFTLMIAGLASALPRDVSAACSHTGSAPPGPITRPRRRRSRSSSPPSSATTRSSTWSGARPRRAGAADRAELTGPGFFPHLISAPFHDGLEAAFTFAIVACLWPPSPR